MANPPPDAGGLPAQPSQGLVQNQDLASQRGGVDGVCVCGYPEARLGVELDVKGCPGREFHPRELLLDLADPPAQTISCLLIHPNPDSALNSTAGALLQEDYDAFSRHAEIMTSIHAPVPDKLSSSVKDAKLRGEDDVGTVIQEQRHEQTRLPLPQREKGSRLHPLRMKAKPVQNAEPSHIPEPQAELSSSDEEEDDLTSAAKENDQSLCSSPAKLAPRSPRKNALGKRPLSVLSMPPDLSDIVDTDHHDDMGAMTASEKNIAANVPDSSPQRKSPKLSAFSTAINKNTNDVRVFEDIPGPVGYLQGTTSVDKGNHFRSGSTRREVHSTSVTQQGSQVTINPVPRSRKVSSSSASSSKRKPRVGILRL